jgi:isopentenyl-diphosphate delta-isomerase
MTRGPESDRPAPSSVADQQLLVVDDQGRLTGEVVSRGPAHSGAGRRHLALVVLLFDRRQQVLLQRRKHRLFDDRWDFSAATHPLRRSDGSDETLDQAAARCLACEYGIAGVAFEALGAFDYFARDGALCENEHCVLLVGHYDGPARVAPAAGYACRWIAKRELMRELESQPKSFTPWALAGARLLRRSGWLA